MLMHFVPHIYAGRAVCCLVPEVGIEPTHLSILHFECNASTNSAIRARHLIYFTQVFRITKRYRKCSVVVYETDALATTTN